MDGWTIPINSMAPLNVAVAFVFLTQNLRCPEFAEIDAISILFGVSVGGYIFI